ncbi:MAG: hypothetical protein ACQEUZ_06410 [Pseudomonadota bacterium]
MAEHGGLPEGTAVIEIDGLGDGSTIRVSHDGDFLFARQTFNHGDGQGDLPTDELWLSRAEARSLAAVLIQMADMLDRRD